MPSLVILDVNDCRPELPGRHLPVEQDVRLAVGAVLELRQEEEGHHPADHGCAAPDVAALAREVPTRRVEQLRGEVDHGDLGDVVGGATHGGAQGAEAHRGRLGDDGVRDGSQGAGEDEGDEDSQHRLRVVGRRALRDRGADAEDEEQDDVGGCAPEVDGSAAEPGGERPGEGVGDELETRVDQVELEGTIGSDTGL